MKKLIKKLLKAFAIFFVSSRLSESQRMMKGYNIDLNKELGFTHLEPVTKPKQRR